MLFADRLCEDNGMMQELLGDPKARKVRVHRDVVDHAETLIERTSDAKIKDIAKFTCWPDYDTWIEWTGDLEDGKLLDFGFYFHGDNSQSVLEGTGICIICERGDEHPAIIPVRYDLERYSLTAHDITDEVKNKMVRLRAGDPMRVWMEEHFREAAGQVDPILLAAKTAPVLGPVKPLLFALLAFMNSPKIIRHDPSDLTKLNARRVKRGKYPYHPHHEIRLNIDKHKLNITAPTGEGSERGQYFVRAHLRFLVHPRYKNVSVTLVEPHYRGNPEIGMRNTSYAVGRQNSTWPVE